MVVVLLLVAATAGATGSAIRALQHKRPLMAATMMFTSVLFLVVLMGYAVTYNVLELIREAYEDYMPVR